MDGAGGGGAKEGPSHRDAGCPWDDTARHIPSILTFVPPCCLCSPRLEKDLREQGRTPQAPRRQPTVAVLPGSRPLRRGMTTKPSRINEQSQGGAAPRGLAAEKGPPGASAPAPWPRPPPLALRC